VGLRTHCLELALLENTEMHLRGTRTVDVRVVCAQAYEAGVFVFIEKPDEEEENQTF